MIDKQKHYELISNLLERVKGNYWWNILIVGERGNDVVEGLALKCGGTDSWLVRYLETPTAGALLLAVPRKKISADSLAEIMNENLEPENAFDAQDVEQSDLIIPVASVLGCVQVELIHRWLKDCFEALESGDAGEGSFEQWLKDGFSHN